MGFWPEKVEFKDVIINSLWAFIAWVIGSISMLLIAVFMSSFIDVVWGFSWGELGLKTSAIFTFFVSIIALIWTSISIFMTYIFLHYTSAEKYKRSLIIFGQLSFFIIFMYFLVTPIYVVKGLENYENLMFIYLGHILVLAFGTSLLMEVLNKYRYVLIGIYGSFLWLVVSWIFTMYIFNSFSGSFAKLITLLVLLPVVNFLMIFFKHTFEFLYYQYNKLTNLDQMWDIFYQIEEEEKEALREEEEKNSL